MGAHLLEPECSEGLWEPAGGTRTATNPALVGSLHLQALKCEGIEA